jgi:sulfonate transport system ATP-binding protein
MSSSEDVLLESRGIGHTFAGPDGGDGVRALDDVSTSVRTGEYVCLVGPSGCGKSTLLNIMVGLIKPTEGEIRYEGRRLDGVNTGVGYLTQADTLLPWRTVRRNVGLPLDVLGVGKDERAQRTQDILKLVGLDTFSEHYPSQLSGGMRKRALLARTLVYEPRMLFLDEPFGALDAQLRLRLQSELVELCDRMSTTVVMVTHDLEEALFLSHRILVFATDPGRIVHEHKNTLPWPRNFLELKSSPEFARMWGDLWAVMSGSPVGETAGDQEARV